VAGTQSTLYLVGTPIGNLEDITLRALRVLKEADIIACEDTRQTAKLLAHHGIETRMVSYHQHNELTRSAQLVMQLEQGKSIALVSDAGTPGVSDPGFRLVSLAIRRKIPVVPVPGPSAFLSALVASGLPTESFTFHGFLPARLGQRRKLLEELSALPSTQIFYEAPHRLLGALEDIVEVMGASRSVVVAREVTKLHEEFVRGTAAQVLAEFEKRNEIRGEITLLVGRVEESGKGSATKASMVAKKNARTRVRELMTAEGIDGKEAMKRVAKELGVGKSEVYRQMQRGGKK
jgi:16S rRNA (cytidine1402-2'-O)-methyltransferase